MSITIAVVLFVLLLMTVILFLLLKREVNDINNKCKIYFIRKSQEYTDSINHQEQQSHDTITENNVEEKEKDNKDSQGNVIYVEKKANYEINDLLKMMKKIDDSFDVNNIKVIQSFIKEHVKNDKEKIHKYNDLIKMKKKVDEIGMYNIITSDDSTILDKIVKDLRLINEDVFMEYYSGKEEFDVQDFYDFLDYEIGKCDPKIYIYVGNSKENYDKIDKRIKTIYSEEIYKGLKIVYLNKLYDYSLS